MESLKTKVLQDQLNNKMLELDLKRQEVELANFDDEVKKQKEWDIEDRQKVQCETARRNLETMTKLISLELSQESTQSIWRTNKDSIQKVIESNLKVLINK